MIGCCYCVIVNFFIFCICNVGRCGRSEKLSWVNNREFCIDEVKIKNIRILG